MNSVGEMSGVIARMSHASSAWFNSTRQWNVVDGYASMQWHETTCVATPPALTVTYLTERRRKANWTECRRLPLAAAACTVWWRPLSPATRTATRDDDADADAARSNHGATRKPPERPHLFHPLRPRLLIVSSRFNPSDTSSFSRPPGRAISPLFYRSYGRGPLRSICLVRAETANRARTAWTVVKKTEEGRKEKRRQFGGLIPYRVLSLRREKLDC